MTRPCTGTSLTVNGERRLVCRCHPELWWSLVVAPQPEGGAK